MQPTPPLLHRKDISHVRAWWEVAGNAVQFGLRYGAVPLQLQPGKSAVEVAKLAELPATIKRLISAAEACSMASTKV